MLPKEVMPPRIGSSLQAHWLLSTFCVALYAGSLMGQAPARLDTVHILAELITVEDGLPQGMVQCVLQDRAGYMWFGTRGGLARNDGYGFTIYQHDDKDSTSIGSNIVRKLLEDHNGQLWLGFESGAVDRYDPRTGIFTHVVRDPLGSLGQLPEIRSLTEDRNGNIWFYAFHGGLRVVRASETGARHTVEEARTAFPGIAWPDRIDGFGIAGNGELWIAYGDSLMVLDPKVQRCLKRGGANYLSPAGEINDRHHHFSPDKEGTGMWLIRGDELYHFKSVVDVQDHITTLRPPIHAPVYSVKEIQGQLWIGESINERILSADAREVPVRFKEIHGKRMKPEIDVICWAEDRSGNIWAGTNGYGVLKVTRMRQRFHHLPDVNTIYRASSSGAMALIKAFDDHWTDATGHILKANVWSSLHARGLVVNPNIWAKDAQGRTWVSTAPQWGSKPELTVIEASGALRFPTIVPDALTTRSIFPGLGDDVWALAVTSALGWQATAELLLIDTRAERLVRRYPFDLGERNWYDVSAFEISPDGTLWLVTHAGLYHLQPSTGAWQHIQHDDRDPRSLPTDRLIGICFDPHDPVNLLWIGTGGSGLVKFDRRSGVVEQYTTKEGLPSNVVYGILPDERGNLWFSTDMGLCRLDPHTKELKRFTFEDGLVGNEFNTRATGATPDGRMFFGGPMGTTWFRPAEFYDTIPPSPTVLTGLRLTNKDVAVGSFMLPGAQAPLLVQALEHVRSITLPFDQRMISFSFACMDHTAPQKNTFRYRLEGFDKEWIEAGTAHEATFTNLDPGGYTFRVQGRNSEGVLDAQGTSIQLTITPPWWGTWWFRICSALLITAGVVAFYRYRLAQAVKVVRVRERIARDLHDEIGSTLSSVSLFSSVAQKKAAGKAPEASELLGRITESTTQVLEAMNDIVWAVNADHDDMASVIKRMQAFAGSVTEARGCTLHLHAQEDLKRCRLEMTQRKNLYLIFKEAVNNAVKYSDCANLRVELVRDKSAIVLRVKDDGKGFDPNAGNGSAGGGNGIGNMRNRAAEIPGTLGINSTPGNGTTLELRFVPGKRSLEPMTNNGEEPR